jgi:hypothetical protein
MSLPDDPQLFTREKADPPFEVNNRLIELLSHALGSGRRGRDSQWSKGLLIPYHHQGPGGGFGTTVIRKQLRKRLNSRA